MLPVVEHDKTTVNCQRPALAGSQLAKQPCRLLWIVNLDPSTGERSGAGLRFINFAKELTRQGVVVFFAVNCWPGDDIVEMRTFLSSLKQQNVIEEFLVLEYSTPRWKATLGALLLYPGLTSWVLKTVRRRTIDTLRTFARENGVSISIISDRMLLFAGAALSDVLPVVFDWCDSAVLDYLRGLGRRLRNCNFRGLYGFLRDFQANLISEAYYGRRPVFNLVVSPIDRKWLGRTNLFASKNRLIMNGARLRAGRPVPKIPKRLIFSGAMDFLPNYEGALWFLDNVFPLVLRKHGDAHLVLAGMNPVPELVARASDQVRVTGFVEDMGAEIACSSLYVSPLVSGSGFKNKIIEAILNGTYVVGTALSFEFLDPELQKLFISTDTAEEMAVAISTFLDDPSRFDSRLEEIQHLFKSSFSWAQRASELAQLLREAQSVYFNQKHRHEKPRSADSVPTGG